MIQANELRIGNKIIGNIIYEGKILTFDYFNQDKTVVFFSDGHKSGIGEFLKHCKGLELTEEILLKCGYLPCSIRDNHYTIKGHTVWLLEDRFYCDKNGVQLKYLHQLQNLYFVLKNKELEIDFK